MKPLLVIGVLVFVLGGWNKGHTAPPNIVVFLVDDLGVMDTSLPFLTDKNQKPKRYPLNDFYRTPNLESLASQGIRFSNFNAMSVCSPSRISLMTGQNAARHRTTNWIDPKQNNAGPQGPKDWNWQGLNRSSISLARLLQANGYRTMHVGKGHFGPLGSEGQDPKNLGFDVNVGGASIGQPASYFGEKNFGNGEAGVRQSDFYAVPGLEKYHGTKTFLTEALTIEARRLIRESTEANQPFFLYFPHYAVHAPFNSDPRFAHHYTGSDKPKPAQAFASLVEGMDRSLGELIDELKNLGVAENTMIFFLGDNGTDAPLGNEHEVACAAPLRGKKGSHYEGGVRVPFVAAWAERAIDNEHQKRFPIKADAVQNQLATVCDLFPTILELANCRFDSEQHVVDGGSLKVLLSGADDPIHPDKFLMHYPHAPHRTNYWTSLRWGAWKVIYHYFPSAVSEESHYQLFHLAEDPFEQNNIARTNPEKLREMMTRLVDELEHCHATYPRDKETGKEVYPVVP